MSYKPMTAEELIEKLKKVNPKLPVYIFSPEGFLMSSDFVVKEYYIKRILY